ncbi:MAG: ABC transporter permease, partial [gamma proteobacterium symbiont of Ctena orbiculata]
MESLSHTTLAALHLLYSGNWELWEIIAISFRVSGVAILVATPPALMVAF